MDALYQGASAAMMLVGIAALLAGIGWLWRAIGLNRVDQGQLALDEASQRRALRRIEAQAESDQRRMALVQALMPAATALLGHWLGSQSGRHAREDDTPDFDLHCHGCARRPLWAPPAHDDEETVELDLASLIDSLRESGFATRIADLLAQAKASPEASTPTPEPGPEAASASMA